MQLRQIKRILHNLAAQHEASLPRPLVVLLSNPISEYFDNGEVLCEGNTKWKGLRFHNLETAKRTVEGEPGPMIILHLHPSDPNNQTESLEPEEDII